MRIEGFNTDRLTVRRWHAHRPAAGLAAVLTPAVLAHLPPGLQLGDRDPAQWISDRQRESDVFAVDAGDALVGLLILAPVDAVHIGYLFAQDVWGKGYGTELLRGLIAALASSGPVVLRAGVAEDNPASARVLEKAGFRKLAQTDAPGMAMYEMVLD